MSIILFPYSLSLDEQANEQNALLKALAFPNPIPDGSSANLVFQGENLLTRVNDDEIIFGKFGCKFSGIGSSE